jgi:hypothetical protein
MSKKMGRPKLEPGQAKGVIYKARVPSGEASKIDRAIKKAGQTPSDVIRNALSDVQRLNWTTSEWTRADLHGKTVRFQFKTLAQGQINFASGFGRFAVASHRFDESKLAIEIQIDEPHGLELPFLRLSLNQFLVDRIEKHPDQDEAEFRCMVLE